MSRGVMMMRRVMSLGLVGMLWAPEAHAGRASTRPTKWDAGRSGMSKTAGTLGDGLRRMPSRLAKTIRSLPPVRTSPRLAAHQRKERALERRQQHIDATRERKRKQESLRRQENLRRQAAWTHHLEKRRQQQLLEEVSLKASRNVDDVLGLMGSFKPYQVLHKQIKGIFSADAPTEHRRAHLDMIATLAGEARVVNTNQCGSVLMLNRNVSTAGPERTNQQTVLFRMFNRGDPTLLGLSMSYERSDGSCWVFTRESGKPPIETQVRAAP